MTRVSLLRASFDVPTTPAPAAHTIVQPSVPAASMNAREIDVQHLGRGSVSSTEPRHR